MPGKRTPSKGKKINPHFLVFCEGETEEAYVSTLRSKYRIPISIITKISGNSITKRKIDAYKTGKPTDPRDKDYLIYDADVKGLTEKLKSIKAELILSNPGIELWFLLHYKNQTAEITVQDCFKELCNRNRNNYKKGFIDSKLETKLFNNCKQACERAIKSKYPENPSSNFNVFISELEK
jgi:hypothetical protein